MSPAIGSPLKVSPAAIGTSICVSGIVKGGSASSWYGLRQIYGNESWHYELRPRAIDRGALRCMPTPREIGG
jgi:hypothetical protein